MEENFIQFHLFKISTTEKTEQIIAVGWDQELIQDLLNLLTQRGIHEDYTYKIKPISLGKNIF